MENNQKPKTILRLIKADDTLPKPIVPAENEVKPARKSRIGLSMLTQLNALADAIDADIKKINNQ